MVNKYRQLLVKEAQVRQRQHSDTLLHLTETTTTVEDTLQSRPRLGSNYITHHTGLFKKIINCKCLPTSPEQHQMLVCQQAVKSSSIREVICEMVCELIPPQQESPSAEMVMLERLFLQAERYALAEDRRRARRDPGQCPSRRQRQLALVQQLCLPPFFNGKYAALRAGGGGAEGAVTHTGASNKLI